MFIAGILEEAALGLTVQGEWNWSGLRKKGREGVLCKVRSEHQQSLAPRGRHSLKR